MNSKKTIEDMKREHRQMMDQAWFPEGRPSSRAFDAYRALLLPSPWFEQMSRWLNEHPEDLIHVQPSVPSDRVLAEWMKQEAGWGAKVLALFRAKLTQIPSWTATEPAFAHGDDELKQVIIKVKRLADAQGRSAEGREMVERLQEISENLTPDAAHVLRQMADQIQTWGSSDDASFTARVEEALAPLQALTQAIAEASHEG